MCAIQFLWRCHSSLDTSTVVVYFVSLSVFPFQYYSSILLVKRLSVVMNLFIIFQFTVKIRFVNTGFSRYQYSSRSSMAVNQTKDCFCGEITIYSRGATQYCIQDMKLYADQFLLKTEFRSIHMG